MAEDGGDFDTQFVALHQGYLREVSGVNDDDELSQPAKQQRIDQAKAGAEARYEQLMATEERTVRDEFLSARAALGMGAIGRGGGADEQLAHRQAKEIAAAAKTPAQLDALMTRGRVEGDRALEHAAFDQAVTILIEQRERAAKSGRIEGGRGPSDLELLVDDYARRYPATARNLDRLWQTLDSGMQMEEKRARGALGPRARSIVVPKRKASPPKAPAGRLTQGGTTLR